MDSIQKYINENKGRFVDELKEFLKIPSISTNPENKSDVIACSKYVQNELKSLGLENVKIYETHFLPHFDGICRHVFLL